MNYLLSVILILFFLVLINFVLPHLAKLYWKNNNLKLAGSSGKIFLTFDDGPEIASTGEILDTLKKFNIKATFFVIGENAKKNSTLIERMIKEGHAVGIHGNNHLHPWKVNPWKVMKDLAEVNKALLNIGVQAKYIRPPYGKINFFSLIYILSNRFVFIHWNLDPRDYEIKEAEELKAYLQKEISNGKVVLLHDGRRPGTSPVKVTSEGLRLFLQNMKIDSDLFSSISAVY